MSLALLSGCTDGTDTRVDDQPEPSSSSPGAPAPSSSPSENSGPVVTDASELAGRWQAESLFGDPVVQPKGPGSHPVDVAFSQLDTRWWWNTDDGCNATGGRFSINSSGVLTTGGGATTLVGCLGGIPGGKQHGANTKAIEMADQACLLTSDGNQPQTLTLLSDGAVVAVYVARPVRPDY